MKEYNDVSKVTIDRMVLYFREAQHVKREGVEFISSEKLGNRLKIKPGQIRKDLALFGDFGIKGIGYPVIELQRNISKILSLHRSWRIAIVGFGHLGGALASYRNFITVGIKLSAIFDNDSVKVGKKFNGIPISNIDILEDVIKEQDIHIGVITLPATDAQYMADRMIRAGVRAIWNFAPVRLKVPEDIVLVSEDLSVSAGRLSYYLSQTESREIDGVSWKKKQPLKHTKCILNS